MTYYEVVKILCNIDPTTVIDDNWFVDGLHFTEQNCLKLLALLKFTGLNTYKQVLEQYEGYTIVELLESKSILKQ